MSSIHSDCVFNIRTHWCLMIFLVLSCLEKISYLNKKLFMFLIPFSLKAPAFFHLEYEVDSDTLQYMLW